MSNQIINSSVTALVRRSLVAGSFEKLFGFLIRDNYRIVDIYYTAKVSSKGVEVTNCEAFSYNNGDYLKSIEPYRLDRDTLEMIHFHAAFEASKQKAKGYASKN